MFDALHAGCVPLILSKDFVWPFSKEFDTLSNSSGGKDDDASSFLDPSLFSIRLDAKAGRIELTGAGVDRALLSELRAWLTTRG